MVSWREVSVASGRHLGTLLGSSLSPRRHVCSLQCLMGICTATQATGCAMPAALPRTGPNPWTSALTGKWMP